MRLRVLGPVEIQADDGRRLNVLLWPGPSATGSSAPRWLGDTHKATQDLPAARDAWGRAQDILTDLGHPDADAVRAKLDTAGR